MGVSFARRIKAARWAVDPKLGATAVSGDVVKCVSPSDAKLSMWACSDDQSDAAEVALALASGFKVLEGFQIVFLNEKDIATIGVSVIETLGTETKIPELAERHRDLQLFDISRLNNLIETIAGYVRGGQGTVSFTKTTIFSLLEEALRTGRLKFDDLKKEMRDDIEKARRRASASSNPAGR